MEPPPTNIPAKLPSKIKLKLKAPLKIDTESVTAPLAATPVVATPTPKTGLKIKIISKNAASTPSTPAPSSTPGPIPAFGGPHSQSGLPVKAAKKEKGSANRKRSNAEFQIKEEDETIVVGVPEHRSSVAEPPAKKLKLKINGKASGTAKNSPLAGGKTPMTAIKTPLIKVKRSKQAQTRALGEGYDSEASDREEDPQIEEGWILRMAPGEDATYLSQAIAERKIGVPKTQGGADIRMRYFDAFGHRGAITIRGNCYAFTMVHLPTIIEGMKSWDRRGFFKSVDICQMQWVFAKVDKEEEAKTIPLPREVYTDKDDPNKLRVRDGLTAPMANAEKRRFRKRQKQKTNEAIELAVEALLKKDAEYSESTFGFTNPNRGTSQLTDGYGRTREAQHGDDDGEEDAEGEEDTGYFDGDHHGYGDHEEDENDEDEAQKQADIRAALEAEFGDDFEEEPPQASMGETPMSMNNDGMGKPGNAEEEDDSGDESVEEEEDESEEEVDEATRLRQIEITSARQDLETLQRERAEATGKLTQILANPVPNAILKARFESQIIRFDKEIELKQAFIGEDDED